MDIISRSEAQALGLSKYFTGQPCKNGHINHRYTTSGTCQSCINGPKSSSVEADPNMIAATERLQAAQIAYREQRDAALRQYNQDLDASRQERLATIRAEADAGKPKNDPNAPARRTARDQLVQIKLWCNDDDLLIMKATVHAYAIMHFPILTQGDVFPALLPTNRASSDACYRLYCHSDDIQDLREFEKTLHAARSGRFVQDQANRLAASLAMVPEEPIPDWADRP